MEVLVAIAEIDRKKLQDVTCYAQNFLLEESAPGPDPGRCIADIKKITASQDLIEFGHSAKKVVLSKEEAYRRTDVHLSEHGGTGQGIIGAIAGVDLRMTGNDGRFKRHFKINFSVLWLFCWQFEYALRALLQNS